MMFQEQMGYVVLKVALHLTTTPQVNTWQINSRKLVHLQIPDEPAK
jgi:hypothetical protein